MLLLLSERNGGRRGRFYDALGISGLAGRTGLVLFPERSIMPIKEFRSLT
jgi:hypothetical protein